MALLTMMIVPSFSPRSPFCRCWARMRGGRKGCDMELFTGFQKVVTAYLSPKLPIGGEQILRLGGWEMGDLFGYPLPEAVASGEGVGDVLRRGKSRLFEGFDDSGWHERAPDGHRCNCDAKKGLGKKRWRYRTFFTVPGWTYLARVLPTL